jgi:hypothetical protein
MLALRALGAGRRLPPVVFSAVLYWGKRPPLAALLSLCLCTAQAAEPSARAEQKNQDQEEEQQLAPVLEAAAIAEDNHQQYEEHQQGAAFVSTEPFHNTCHRANLLYLCF